jgi:DNA-binding CsgD family transcriptional regulator
LAISYRPMRAKDLAECVSIVATHPLIGPRYADAIKNLRSVWGDLLGREAFRAVVFEDSRRSRANIIGVGVSAFVSDEFLASIKKTLSSWIGPKLTRCVAHGELPLLTDRAVREANANGGLNLVTWEGAICKDYWQCAEIHATVISAFVEQHRGFFLKEVLGQPSTREGLDTTLRSGTQMLSKDGRYVDPSDSFNEVALPICVGLTREVARSRPGAWLASLFLYQAPLCGFRASEQRLLLAALRGGTDQELADYLGISLSAVKKTWLSIYSRASTHLPSLLLNAAATQEDGERGREKKYHLLAYLRNHPEELRPACM